MKTLLWFTIASVLLTSGCASRRPEKATLQRGWIGGEFQQTSLAPRPPGQRRVVYVKQIYPETPAEQAGLKPADVIVAVNGDKVPSLTEFRRRIDSASPGSRAAIQVLRDGQSMELPVTMGRESYRQWHGLRLGLSLSNRIDLWPDPDFTLFSLIQYKRGQERPELRSPEEKLEHLSSPSSMGKPTTTRSDEGWDAWFLIAGFDAHKEILSQESVQPGAPSP